MGEPKTVCILGRQPALGLAELESLYGSSRLEAIPTAALLDVPAAEINFKHLGGTVKTAKLLALLPYSDWKKISNFLVESVPRHLQHTPEGKFTFGISAYGHSASLNEINRTALLIKKAVKQTGRPVRAVPNKSPQLNAAQVLHNKLTHRGGWELLLIKNGGQTVLAQTLFVQDIGAYAARDQARPKRDARVGMLPPKLAQIILNLALGQRPPDRPARILDPFCGTGIILQEALMMGYDAIGTDLDERMVSYAKENIGWLFGRQPQLQGHVAIEPADATAHRWPRFTAVASELYLGRPFSAFPAEAKLKAVVSDVNAITGKFLQNIAPQLKPKQRLCLAVPAWRQPSGQFIHLPIIAKLTDMGYNRVSFKHVKNDDLLYYREGQIVARQLLVLEKQ